MLLLIELRKKKDTMKAVNEYKERVYEESLNSNENATQKVYVRPTGEDDLYYD